MLNETKILENRVCKQDGRTDALNDMLHLCRAMGRKTLPIDMIERMLRREMIEYEKAWNKWADAANIGGGRYDETGQQHEVCKATQ